MTYEEFIKSIESGKLPAGLSIELQALWYEGNDEWDRAHTLVQPVPTKNASWVHAYLHRKEGDLGNASYWYSKAGKEMPKTDLKTEWTAIVKVLLKVVE